MVPSVCKYRIKEGLVIKLFSEIQLSATLLSVGESIIFQPRSKDSETEKSYVTKLFSFFFSFSITVYTKGKNIAFLA